jgi:hypothetical protein
VNYNVCCTTTVTPTAAYLHATGLRERTDFNENPCPRTPLRREYP